MLIASDKPDWMQDPVIGRGKNNNNNNRNADINRNAGSETEQTGKNHIVCLYNHSVMYASLNKKKCSGLSFLKWHSLFTAPVSVPINEDALRYSKD